MLKINMYYNVSIHSPIIEEGDQWVFDLNNLYPKVKFKIWGPFSKHNNLGGQAFDKTKTFIEFHLKKNWKPRLCQKDAHLHKLDSWIEGHIHAWRPM